MARRRQARKCSAKRTDGEPCESFAVTGAHVCRSHGGSAGQVLRKAAQRRLEQKVVVMAEKYITSSEPVKDPLTALLQVAGEIASMKDFVGGRVAELRAEEWRYEGLAAEQLRAEVSLYERALDRTAKVLVDISKLNLEERQVKIAEAQAALLAVCLKRILDQLELTPHQRVLVGTVVPTELRRIADQERQALETAVTK